MSTTRHGRFGAVRNAAGLDLWIYDAVDAEYGVDCGQLVRELAAAGLVRSASGLTPLVATPSRG